MAKELRNGGISIGFDSAGNVIAMTGSIVVGSSDDPNFQKVYSRKMELTAGQKSTLENFIAGKLAELKLDEGIS